MTYKMKVPVPRVCYLTLNDKLLSSLALNVCGMLSEMKHPDFVSFISNHCTIAVSDSKLDDTDSVDVHGYMAFYLKNI